MIKYKMIKIIDSFDWDQLVIQTYGKPYCFQQQDGCQERGTHNITVSKEEVDDSYMNDTIPEKINGEKMGVRFSVWLARDPEEWNGEKEESQYVRLFWKRNFYPDIQVIANDMCRKGLIESGDYTINIDW